MDSYWARCKFLIIVCGVIATVHIINVQLGYQLNNFGIYPRHLDSLPHIFAAPFLHGDLGHLVNNLMGMAIFGALCLIRSPRFFIVGSLFVIVFGGLLVWLFGRTAWHIGASGWVFGLWSMSIAIAWFDRRLKNILIALAVLFFYGGMIYGVLPIREGVSFESHFFGALAGIIWASIYAKTSRKAK